MCNEKIEIEKISKEKSHIKEDLKEFMVSISRDDISLLRQCISKFEESSEIYLDIRGVSDDIMLNRYRTVIITAVSLEKYLKE